MQYNATQHSINTQLIIYKYSVLTRQRTYLRQQFSGKTVWFTLQLSDQAHTLVQVYVTGCFQQCVRLRSSHQLSCVHGQCSVTALKCCQGFFYVLQITNDKAETCNINRAEIPTIKGKSLYTNTLTV